METTLLELKRLDHIVAAGFGNREGLQLTLRSGINLSLTGEEHENLVRELKANSSAIFNSNLLVSITIQFNLVDP